jgi:CubicO group peptidase (beta-lactamase class C family)
MPRRSKPALSVVALMASVLFTGGLPSPLSGQAPELGRGRWTPGALSDGDTARYTVRVADNTFLLGEVQQLSVDVAVRLVDSGGTQVGRFDGLGRGGERFARRLEKGGVYTIEVFAGGEESGEYRITLHRLEPVATDPRKLTDQVMARFDGSDTPGAAVQVWRDGKTLYSRAYGMANLTYGIPFRPETRTNIGSTSKQFTAFAVMLQQERGLLSLDDDIRKHVPELPAFDQVVTVRHIITHTSGLREFLNLLMMSGRRLDHGDWIDRSELVDIVQRQPALQNAPGAEWNYNNTAFGLAALIVERTSGQPFHVFMQENVFGPLGMTHTMVRPSPEHIVPGGSEGYTPGKDGYMALGDLGGAVGAGGIYTTVGDLQIWVENYARPRIGSREIFDEMMTSYVLTDGKETGYGYGLSVDDQRGLKRVHHGGADVSHRSMLVYYPEIDAGLTVQSNHGQFASGVAFELAEAFFGDAMEAEAAPAAEGAPFDPAAYDAEDFDDFAGRYSLDAAPDFVLTFFREASRFYTQATGQARMEIVPTSDSAFALTAVEASVVFHRNAEGKVDGLTLNQNGENHATRLEGEEPEAWAPGAAELDAFTGRFFSEELEAFYTITRDGEKLTVHHRRLDDFELTPGEVDAFTGGDLSFTFERDRNGRVIGFYVANGRTRDVRFARVG